MGRPERMIRLGGESWPGGRTPPSRDRTVRFGVSLPESLLRELDRMAASKGCVSRSEYIRDLVREGLVEEKWEAGDDPVVGVLVIVYDHHQPDLVRRIMDAQHRGYLHTICTTHVHLDEDACLEVVITRGTPCEIEELSGEIGGLRGVRLAKLIKASKIQA